MKVECLIMRLSDLELMKAEEEEERAPEPEKEEEEVVVLARMEGRFLGAVGACRGVSCENDVVVEELEGLTMIADQLKY